MSLNMSLWGSDHYTDYSESSDSVHSLYRSEESFHQNFHGWTKFSGDKNNSVLSSERKLYQNRDGDILSLTELAAREIASSIPFELVEHFRLPVPEELQLKIAFWSFPEHEEEIRLYSCLANGSGDEYVYGEGFLKNDAVENPLQIGFYLSATVERCYVSSVTFDRRKIVSCQCSCGSYANWCRHVIALCLHRITRPDSVCLRAPISESLNRLQRDQLQKFAQYLISELPEQVLPTAQKILDQLLSPNPTVINKVSGAPDPTSGGDAGVQTVWYLNETFLRQNILKTIVKFCVPSPQVYSDVGYLASDAPPAAAEWHDFLRPLRGRNPEGLWNLLTILSHMFTRHDRNAIHLLSILTQQCLRVDQFVVWWFFAKSAQIQKTHVVQSLKPSMSNTSVAQNACASFCDEIVSMWKLAALNPIISPMERIFLRKRLLLYHLRVLHIIRYKSSLPSYANTGSSFAKISQSRFNAVLNLFPGFKPALEACYIDWDDYCMPEIIYEEMANQYTEPFITQKLMNDTQDHQTATVVWPKSFGRLGNDYEFHYNSVNNDDRVEDEVEVEDIQLLLSTFNPPSQVTDDSNISNESHSIARPQGEVGDSNGGDSTDSHVQVETVRLALASLGVAQSESGTNLQHTDDQHCEDTKNLKASCVKEACVKVSVLTGNIHIIRHFSRLRNEENLWELMFMRAEGLRAHGYLEEAAKLTVHLAKNLLRNKIDLLGNGLPSTTVYNKYGKRKRSNWASQQATQTASNILYHCSFLCTVLSENTSAEFTHLAFLVGMYGLELVRPPACTKPMEVKLAHQEGEIMSLLRKLRLGNDELEILRDRGFRLKQSIYMSRGATLLPLMLSSFIFQSLMESPLQPSDELLGFEAALTSIGLKINVSEAEHPMLCEGTRIQRGDLILLLLTQYKNQPTKLAQIMDKVLDRDIHQLIRLPIVPEYYSERSLDSFITDDEVMDRLQKRDILGAGCGDNWKYQKPPKTAGDAAWMGEDVAIHTVPPPAIPSFNTNEAHHSDSGSSGNSSGDSNTDNPQLPPRNEILLTNAQISLMSPVALDDYFKNTSCVQYQAVPKLSKHGNYRWGRFKGKGPVFPLLPNQPSEASSHFYDDLAKRVLIAAGCTMNNSWQRDDPQRRHITYRGLQMCAFQIGLYSLGLHNRVSPNWLSRTYSSHVTWITAQALEIGAVAIQFLAEMWEGHLTPPEITGIADKASRRQPPVVKKLASSLALSALKHSAALNKNQIQRAIEQCREQGANMFEEACLAVENAAIGGGVLTEVIFEVARHWFDMYRETYDLKVYYYHEMPNSPSPPKCSMFTPNFIPGSTAVHRQPDEMMHILQQQQNALIQQQSRLQLNTQQLSILAAASVGLPYSSEANPSNYPNNMSSSRLQFPWSPYFGVTGNGSSIGLSTPPFLPPPVPLDQTSLNFFGPRPVLWHNPWIGSLHPLTDFNQYDIPPPLPVPGHAQATSGNSTMNINQAHHQNTPVNDKKRFLLTAYRVGMLALENLGRRMKEDKVQFINGVSKFALNPSYGDDVKWLFTVAIELGLAYIQNFVICVINTIISPFLLQDLTWNCATYFASAGFVSDGLQVFPTLHKPPSEPLSTGLILKQIRTHSHVLHLLDRCYRLYYECIHQKLFQLTKPYYDEFIAIVVHAKTAFSWTPEGAASFQALMQSIKRSKYCKKDFYTKLVNATDSAPTL